MDDLGVPPCIIIYQAPKSASFLGLNLELPVPVHRNQVETVLRGTSVVDMENLGFLQGNDIHMVRLPHLRYLAEGYVRLYGL